MKRSIITFALATTVALGMAGCASDKAAHTATQVAPVPGFSATFVQQDGPYSVSVRNAYLVYPGPDGYKAGDDATVKIWLFNDTQNEVTVVLRSDAGTVTPAEPIRIPAAGMVAHEAKLTLREAILPGPSVPVRVEFVGIHEFITQLTIAPPDAAQPRTPLEFEEEAGEDH